MPTAPTCATTSVNPARAGMIPASARATAPAVGKPRASGDDPHVNAANAYIFG